VTSLLGDDRVEARGSEPGLPEEAGNKIGRIGPRDLAIEISILTANSRPFRIATGPDLNLWFIELDGNKIGRLMPVISSQAGCPWHHFDGRAVSHARHSANVDGQDRG
jgi:hypothetical protein